LRYRTAGAFRQALETRLRDQHLQSNLPVTRLRKMVAFDRFLARLVRDRPRLWVIKGGLALQLRLGDRARTTKDIDVALTKELERKEVVSRLRRAASASLRDWFEFEVGEPSEAATGAPKGGLRFPIRCLVDGREFERFSLDIGQGEPSTGKIESITGPQLLDFAGISPTKVPCYPLCAQIAEKFHACTRPYAGGVSSRVRDLVDILLMASMGNFLKKDLERALQATFETRATHAIPPEFPKLPARWAAPYKRLAKQMKLGWSSINTAAAAAARFLNPVLWGPGGGRWSPAKWQWK
jgi:hypothetical protein